MIQNKSHFFHKFGNYLYLNELNVFDSLCYTSTLHDHRTKLDSRARKSIFLKYKPNVKCVVVFNLITKTIFLSIHVTNHDHISSYYNPNQPFHWTYHLIYPIAFNIEIEPYTINELDQIQERSLTKQYGEILRHCLYINNVDE